ncbi:hypothetical protein [Pyrodictium delaneyi]|uniref:hypothetical protein n=1 Tax=Pyrodictium delaneyi TaxID=1273541 RepID=UPI0012E19892|nr:hypothetical protein [Pyrodictium delaneyi]
MAVLRKFVDGLGKDRNVYYEVGDGVLLSDEELVIVKGNNRALEGSIDFTKLVYTIASDIKPSLYMVHMIDKGRNIYVYMPQILLLNAVFQWIDEMLREIDESNKRLHEIYMADLDSGKYTSVERELREALDLINAVKEWLKTARVLLGWLQVITMNPDLVRGKKITVGLEKREADGLDKYMKKEAKAEAEG